MPILSVYLGSTVISAGLIYSPDEASLNATAKNTFATLPYPVLQSFTKQEKNQFVSTFLQQLVADVDPTLKFSDINKYYASVVDRPDFLGDSTTTLDKLYMGDTAHIFCANSFYMHTGKSIYATPYPRFTTDIYNEDEKVNVLANFEAYPFNFPSDEFSQGLFDDAIIYLQNTLSPKTLNPKNQKNKKEYYKKTKQLTFTGDRFTKYQMFPDGTYFLITSLLEDFGIFNIQIDTQNISTHKLNYEKNFTTVAQNPALDFANSNEAIINAGTFIKFTGEAECLFQSQVGAQQLFQLQQNQVHIVPLALGEKAKITIKGSGFDTVDATVEGGELGVVFMNFEKDAGLFAGMQASFAKEIKSAVRENLARF